MIRRNELIAIMVAAALVLAGCHAPLIRPITCDQVLQLRLGQSVDDVRGLLGAAAAEVAEGSSYSNGERTHDWLLIYGTGDLTRTPPALVSDHLHLRFLRGRLVAVIAERRSPWTSPKRALWVGVSDSGRGPEPPKVWLTATFGEIFNCPNGFDAATAAERLAAANGIRVGP